MTWNWKVIGKTSLKVLASAAMGLLTFTAINKVANRKKSVTEKPQSVSSSASAQPTSTVFPPHPFGYQPQVQVAPVKEGIGTKIVNGINKTGNVVGKISAIVGAIAVAASAIQGIAGGNNNNNNTSAFGTPQRGSFFQRSGVSVIEAGRPGSQTNYWISA